MTTTTAPFDLAAAQAGAILVTRGGIPAALVGYDPHSLHPIIFRVSGAVIAADAAGIARYDGIASAEDLFMVVEVPEAAPSDEPALAAS